MTTDNIAQFATIMVEYEAWRKAKSKEDVDLSVSAFLDQYALTKQAEKLAEVVELADAFEDDEDFGFQVRLLIND